MYLDFNGTLQYPCQHFIIRTKSRSLPLYRAFFSSKKLYICLLVGCLIGSVVFCHTYIVLPIIQCKCRNLKFTGTRSAWSAWRGCRCGASRSGCDRLRVVSG